MYVWLSVWVCGGGIASKSPTIINQKRRVAFRSQWAPCLKNGLALDMSTDWTTERVFGLELTYAMQTWSSGSSVCVCVCVSVCPSQHALVNAVWRCRTASWIPACVELAAHAFNDNKENKGRVKNCWRPSSLLPRWGLSQTQILLDVLPQYLFWKWGNDVAILDMDEGLMQKQEGFQECQKKWRLIPDPFSSSVLYYRTIPHQ